MFKSSGCKALFLFCVYASVQANTQDSVGQQPSRVDVASSSSAGQQFYDRATELISNKNLDEGIKNLEKAVELGNANAAFELGSYYELGIGKDVNYLKAKELYEKAIGLGHVDAKFNLALLLIDGNASFNDVGAARQYMKDLAEMGDVEAKYSLALLYLQSSEDVEVDLEASLNWLRLAAEAGHPPAQFNYALHFLNGDGVNKSPQRALMWFQKAADQGLAPAFFNLALMNERGEGTPKNMEKAIEFYQKASQLGDAPAKQNLGIKYLLGSDVTRDDLKAVELISEAAEQGLRNSQYLMGRLYQSGRAKDVLPVDLGKAEEWYLLAAQQGHVDAQFYLANLQFAQSNSVVANFWLNQAIASGHAGAKKLKADIEKKASSQ